MILGIDEVGRGPWAGPLVVGACVLGGAQIDGLTDSKKLSKKQREKLNLEIREKAAGFGLGWVDAAKIDKIGLSKALSLATRRAVEQIHTPYDEIVIDGTINFLADTNKGKYVATMKKADLLVPSVSAASIIAKVARDNFMIEQSAVYPEYGFEKHVGYGTAAHIAAIDRFGVTPLHRLSFAPLKKYAVNVSTDKIKADNMLRTSKTIGNDGEDAAARHLISLGYEIIDRNWKTKYCEIDIVAKKSNTINFVEVKYRKDASHGGGLGAITSKKQHQMKFAAECYAKGHNLEDMNLRLCAISVSGNPPAVDDFLELE